MTEFTTLGNNSLPYIRHCEPPLLLFGGDTCAARQCGEQSPYKFEIASGKKQERPRNDGIYSYLYGREGNKISFANCLKNSCKFVKFVAKIF